MSRLNEREIARKLAERDELEPPAGLLEKIKSEIPPTIPVGVPEAERRSPMPSRQRWLIAASLIVMIGAGLLSLQVRMRVPAVQEAARLASAPRKTDRLQAIPPAPARPLPAPRVSPPQESRQLLRAEQAAPPPSLKSELQPLKSLGYIRPGGAVEEKGRGGVVGGAAGSAPSPAAPAAPPPPAAVQTPAGQEADQITATAESPLLDERRVATGATVSQSELEKVPTARDPWTVLQKTPGVLADRINVGGNESGQQSKYEGPGRSLSIVELKVDSGSYAKTRRDLAEGRLPDSGSVRVADFVSAFGGGASMRAAGRSGFAVRAEGAPTPFVQGPRYRLLSFHLQGPGPLPRGTRVEVELNPEVVEGYRLLGQEDWAVAGERGVTVLYEVELRADIPPQGRVATLRLRNPAGTEGTLDLSRLAPSWEKASPGFRLTALAAELAEILKGSPAKGSLAEVTRQARDVGRQLPKSAGASDLADLAKRAARLRERQ